MQHIRAASTATGNYTLAQLPPGPYEITVTVPGFKTFLRRNLQVQVAQTLRVDMKLEVGTAAESVTVSAESSLLKTESGDVSHNVTSDRLNSLPILQIGAAGSGSQGVRNPMAVTNLAPGTYWQPNFQVRVNGAPSNSEQIRIEGQDATNGVVSFAQAETQPSVDAIQELSIQTSNYAAEFGQAGSGVFNFTMKSGTNQYHGTAYEYFVNEALNSGLAYQNVRPQQRRNDFGGTFGGPIWIPKVYDGHDRSFFFFNYEQFRENISISDFRNTVPTAAYRAGDFTTVLTGRALTGGAATDALGRPLMEGMIFDPLTEALAPNGKRVRDQFPGNQIPVTRFDPVSKKILALVPNPTDSSLFQNGIYPFNSLRVSPIPALKLDHSFTSASKLSFYWSTSETAVQECRPLCGSTGFPNPISQTRGTFIESYTMRLNFDHTLTPTLLLHLGAGILSNDFKDTSPTTDYNAVTELGLRGATFNSRFPQFCGVGPLVARGSGASNTGGLDQLGPGAQSRSREAKPTFNASLAWVKDNHTFKFGGDLVIDGHPTAAYTSTAGTYNFSAEQTSNSSVEGLSLGGRFLGFPFASFVLGAADNVTIAALANSRGGRQFWGFYAQDTWKVTRKLTVDYGLRWDYFTYPREQYGRSPDFSPTTPNPSAGGHPGATIFEATCNCRFAKNYPFAVRPAPGTGVSDRSQDRAPRRDWSQLLAAAGRLTGRGGRVGERIQHELWRPRSGSGHGNPGHTHLAESDPRTVPRPRFDRFRQQRRPAGRGSELREAGTADPVEYRRPTGNLPQSGCGGFLRGQSWSLVEQWQSRGLQRSVARAPGTLRAGCHERGRPRDADFPSWERGGGGFPQPSPLRRLPDHPKRGPVAAAVPAVRDHTSGGSGSGPHLVRFAASQGDQALLLRSWTSPTPSPGRRN